MAQPTQFRVLYRSFLTRIIDIDVLAQRGDILNAGARFASVLAAFSFVLTLGIVPKYLLTSLPRQAFAHALWDGEEFLLSVTIAVAGLASVLAWNSFLPDRRDCQLQGSLPIPLRTLALAKTAAAASVLILAVTAVNAFTGPLFPLAIAGPLHCLPAAVFGWWITTGAATLFVFSAVIALQAVASQLLPWRAFLRTSGLLQLLALAAVLIWLFDSPPFAATVQQSSSRAAFLPSYWFTGLLNIFIGRRTPALDQLARIAIRNLTFTTFAAMLTAILAWRRNLRRIVETPDIVASRRRFLLSGIARLCCPKPLDRAIFLFTARTIARSRQHRLLLATYGGATLALSITFLSNARSGWNLPNVQFLTIGWLFLFTAVVGTRAIFVLPQDPGANWLFRITQVRSSLFYFAAVRRTLILIAAMPVWVAAAFFYLSVWPIYAAAGALTLLLLAGLIFAYASLREFRKIPFTCSWFPQTAQSRMKIMTWALVLAVFAGPISRVEMWGLSRPSRFLIFLLILSALTIRLRARVLETAGSGIQFEDESDFQMQTLNLSDESVAAMQEIAR